MHFAFLYQLVSRVSGDPIACSMQEGYGHLQLMESLSEWLSGIRDAEYEDLGDGDF